MSARDPVIVVVPSVEMAAIAIAVGRRTLADILVRTDNDGLDEFDFASNESIRLVNFLGRAIFKRPSRNTLNIHPALPTYAGRGTAARAVFDALMLGTDVVGATVHQMTDDVDGGPIFSVVLGKNPPTLSAPSVYAMCLSCAIEALDNVIRNREEFFSGARTVQEKYSWGRFMAQKEFVEKFSVPYPPESLEEAAMAYAGYFDGKPSLIRE